MYLILRSPLEDVYSSAHCMYATGPCTMVSSWLMDTANALSGSTCGSKESVRPPHNHQGQQTPPI